MRRRVSMWVVIALVAALAATSAAVVVLATNGDDGPTASHRMMQAGEQGPWQMPIMEESHGWDDGRGSDLVPWLLFAIATGTSVGLLIAWSPWRGTPVPVTAGGGTPVAPGPDVMAEAPVAATMLATDDTTATIVETAAESTTPETPPASAPSDPQFADAQQAAAAPEARAPEADTK